MHKCKSGGLSSSRNLIYLKYWFLIFARCAPKSYKLKLPQYSKSQAESSWPLDSSLLQYRISIGHPAEEQ